MSDDPFLVYHNNARYLRYAHRHISGVLLLTSLAQQQDDGEAPATLCIPHDCVVEVVDALFCALGVRRMRAVPDDVLSKLEASDNFDSYKIGLFGPAQCGKTALQNHFIDGTPLIRDQTYIPTVGLDYGYGSYYFEDAPTSSSILDDAFRVQLWDFSGQLRFKSIVCEYLSQISTLIICFDISDRASFDEVRSVWLPAVFEQRPGSGVTAVALLGCKSDLPRHVTREEAEALASQIGKDYCGCYCPYLECSVADNIGLHDAVSVLISDKRVIPFLTAVRKATDTRSLSTSKKKKCTIS
eukprot:PhM_4_TR8734/c0_g1_i13/m.82530/K07893/RAB6A; Ras-related protein Rab-6A